jgi:hypothetical protein
MNALGVPPSDRTRITRAGSEIPMRAYGVTYDTGFVSAGTTTHEPFDPDVVRTQRPRRTPWSSRRRVRPPPPAVLESECVAPPGRGAGAHSRRAGELPECFALLHAGILGEDAMVRIARRGPADRDMDVAALAPEMLVSHLDRLLASLPRARRQPEESAMGVARRRPLGAARRPSGHLAQTMARPGHSLRQARAHLPWRRCPRRHHHLARRLRVAP